MVKNPPTNAGDTRDVGSIPGLGKSTGVGNGNPLQYSCLGNPTDRGAWWATVHALAKSRCHRQLILLREKKKKMLMPTLLYSQRTVKID